MRRFLLSLGLTALFLSGTPTADAAGVSDLSVYLIYDTTGGPVVVGASHDQFASIRNGGPDASPALTVTVTASSGQQLTARTSGSSYTCSTNFARTVLTCQHPAVVRDAIVPLHWSVKYTTATNKKVTVKVTGPNSDPDLSNNTGVINTSLPSSDLRVSASDDTGGRAVVGTTHEQSAFITNDGPSATPSATVTVTASAGQQLTANPSGGVSTCTSNAARTVLTCQFGSIPQGFVYGLHWKTTYTTATAKTVTVKVSGPNVDYVNSDNTAVIHTPGPSSDLYVSDAGDDTGGAAIVGATHQQSAFVGNVGPDASSSPVTVTMTASGGQQLAPSPLHQSSCVTNSAKTVMTCRLAQLARGSGFRMSWSVTYTTATEKTVTVEVSGPHADPAPANNSAAIQTREPTSELFLSDAGDETGGAAVIGETHEQSAFVTNAGPDTSSPMVVAVTASAGQQLAPSLQHQPSCVTNPAKTIMTCKFPELASGSGFRVRWSVTYTTGTAKTVKVNVGGPNADPDLSNNTAIINTPAPKSDLYVANAVDDTGGAAIVGDTHQQSAYVGNHGPHNNLSSKVTVAASAGQLLTIAEQHHDKCVLNAARTIMTCTVPGHLDLRLEWSVTYTTATSKAVTVTIDGQQPDPVASNNKAIIVTPAPRSDLYVANAVDDTGGPAIVGATHQQSAYVGNLGPDWTPSPRVTVTASAGQLLTIAEQHHDKCVLNAARTIMTCAVPGHLDLRLEWSVTYTTDTAKTVTIKVGGQHPDPVTTNNTAVIHTRVPTSDLQVASVNDDTGGPVVVGAIHQQSGLIQNLGPDPTQSYIVTVTASAGQVLSVLPSETEWCRANRYGSVITCSYDPLGNDAGRPVRWMVKYATATTKTVTVKVSGPNADPNTSNNSRILRAFP